MSILATGDKNGKWTYFGDNNDNYDSDDENELIVTCFPNANGDNSILFTATVAVPIT